MKSSFVPRVPFLIVALAGTFHAHAQELVVNGGFENGVEGWSVLYPINELVPTTAFAHSGSRSATWVPEGSAGGQFVPTEYAKTYRISAWFLSTTDLDPAGKPVTGQGFLRYDGVELFNDQDTNGQWVYKSATFVASYFPGLLEVYAWSSDPNGLGGAYVDDVSIQAVPEPKSMAALGLGALGILKRRKKA